MVMYLNKIKIKEIMLKKGYLTQTQLAETLGITKNQLSVMLSEKFNPIKSNVMNLCEKLDIQPLDIISSEKKEGFQISIDFANYTVKKKDAKKRQLASKIEVLELFAGAGGLALGLEQGGLTNICSVEIDKHASETLKINRPHWNVINDDVRNVDFKAYRPQVVTGGFPCQSFSYAGKKLGLEDTRGTLFYEFARCIKETKPILFLAENVRGLISHDDGRTLETILSVFSELGYNIQYRLLKAVNYGVPQKRERVIIIGTLSGVDFEYPEPNEEIKVLRDALKNVPQSEGTQYSTSKKKVLELVPPGGYWRDLPIDIQKSYMGKSFFSSGGRTGMARRISWDEPCLTLTCSPSQKQTERCHPEETRPFTVREYARIQTFPDDWQFSGGICDKYEQIGNAVPVRLGFLLGKQIVKAIENYKSVVGVIKEEEAVSR
ncbi:MAG: DNA (cytosine-5-)-methyltransferase [Desulfitobacteriaceae bacterium]